VLKDLVDPKHGVLLDRAIRFRFNPKGHLIVTQSSESPAIRLVALGGLGEIGMNCLAIEAAGKLLVIDCGVSFPHTDLGVDVYHPDFSYLERRRDRVVGIVLTHGHEDHIGGLPYLLRVLDVPVHGSCHALGLASERLLERGFSPRQIRLMPFSVGQRFEAGPFSIEPVRVSHSIPEACALVIRHQRFTIVHTGDFKFDPDPPDGHATDEERLRQIGDEGVSLLLSDSTNIDAEGMSGSERSVGRALSDVISACETRVVVGLFSSNVHRLRMVGEIAQACGRKITLLGRSAQTQVRVATRCGLLNWPSDLLIPPDLLGSVGQRQSLIIASGTQGEPMAALSRLSFQTHPALTLAPKDVLVLSSRVIPGNDPAVSRMISNFIRQGVSVVHRVTNPSIHVSGHAHRDEQRRMIELLRPSVFVPVHGTLHHLHRHAEFARSLGVPTVMAAENGEVLELSSGGIRVGDVVEVGKIATYNGDELLPSVLKQREYLGRHGVAVLTLAIDARGRMIFPPWLSTRGVLDDMEERDVLNGAVENVVKALSSWSFSEQNPSDQEVMEVAERAVQRSLDGLSSRRPMTIVHVVRA
jgi:ribonuclease J